MDEKNMQWVLIVAGIIFGPPALLFLVYISSRLATAAYFRSMIKSGLFQRAKKE